MKTLLAVSLGLALTGSFAATAQTPGDADSRYQDAQYQDSPQYQDSHCGDRNEIVAKLGQVFQESPTAMGLVNQDAVIEIFVSAQGTWTILASGTDGKSCVVSSGESWESSTMAAGEDA